jgi:hypothetical protein
VENGRSVPKSVHLAKNVLKRDEVGGQIGITPHVSMP